MPEELEQPPSSCECECSSRTGIPVTGLKFSGTRWEVVVLASPAVAVKTRPSWTVPTTAISLIFEASQVTGLSARMVKFASLPGTMLPISFSSCSERAASRVTALSAPSRLTRWSGPATRPDWVVRFYNQRGTAEQHIKEGKYAFRWTRLSCRKFRDNEVRLQLHALAYNLATFLRCIELPEAMADWSLTSLQLKLIKIGARVVRHARTITFQLAEVAVTGTMVRAILAAIRRLRAPPLCA